MGLQVRLIHPLGDRLLDLTPRGADNPLVVGRSSEADISVPSVNVSRRHALLFFHEGHWVIQDGGGGRGTFVNGEPVTDPRFLNLGDVITLGTDANPPTLVIDPHGVAQAAAPVSPRAPGPYLDDASQQPANPFAPSQPQAFDPALDHYPAPNAAAGPIFVNDEGDDGSNDSIESAPPAPISASSPRVRTPKRPARNNSLSPAAITGLVVVGAVVFIVIGVVIYNQVQERNRVLEHNAEVAKQQTQTQVSPDSGTNSKSIFDDPKPAKANRKPARPSAEASDPASGVPVPRPSQRPAPTPKPGDEDDAPAAAADPRASDPEWNELQHIGEATLAENPARALLELNDYLNNHEGTKKYAADAEQMKEKAMDTLWWMRIGVAIQKRDELRQQMAKVNKDIAEDPNSDFSKKTLAPQKDALAEQIDGEEQTLKAMKYDSPDRPNVHDESQIATLRQSRDAQAYDLFKKATASELRRLHALRWLTTR